MVIDSSALVALPLGEPEADEFTRAIAAATARRVSTASYLEAGIVRLVDELSLEIVPVSRDQAELALAAISVLAEGAAIRRG